MELREDIIQETVTLCDLLLSKIETGKTHEEMDIKVLCMEIIKQMNEVELINTIDIERRNKCIDIVEKVILEYDKKYNESNNSCLIL